MKKDTLAFKPGVYLALAVYFALGFSTLTWGNRFAEVLFDEDRYFENVGALSLFIAAGLCFYAFLYAVKTRKITGIFWGRQLVYLGLALLFFFGAGEEISWGQRVFGIAQPEALSQQNVQDELNIHNLAVFENSKILRADNIFNVFWFGFAVLIPLGSLVSGGFRRFAEKWTPVVHWSIGAMFMLNYAMAGISKIVFSSIYAYPLISLVQAVQEVKESNYEFLFVFLGIYIIRDLKNLANGQTSRA